MKRRSLILGAVATCGYFLTRRAEASLSLTQKVLGSKPLHRSEQMATNQAYLVKPNTVYYMPRYPKHGDHIQIVVDQSSLLNPSSLRDETNHKIINDKEPLILDSLAILKLTFDAQEKNWRQT